MLALDRKFSFDGSDVVWGCLSGPAGRPPVVLVHGFPWSSHSWRRIAPWLARTRSVYFYDMIGCGQSDKSNEQDVSPAAQSALLAQLLDHWGLERPAVVAHDFGGLAALRGHFLHGLAYSELFLIDPVAVLPSGSAFFRYAREHADSLAQQPDLAHEAVLSAYIGSGAASGLRRDVIDMYASAWRGATGKPAFYRQIAQSGDQYIESVQECYAPLGFDSHLIWGRHDQAIPIQQGYQLASALKPSSFTEVPDAGHLVMEDAPEAVVAVLLGAVGGRA